MEDRNYGFIFIENHVGENHFLYAEYDEENNDVVLSTCSDSPKEVNMRKTKIEKEFSQHIMWLQRYYKKSRGNPLNPILLQMLQEREQETGLDRFNDLDCRIYFAWLSAISYMINNTDNNMMQLIKDVYVHRILNMTAAGAKYLNYAKSQTQQKVRAWFVELNRQHYAKVIAND